jgi:adenylate kinase family enzyme
VVTTAAQDIGTRISVIGNSGSGKTWIASRLADRLAAPHVEMDALRHGPNWRETPDEQFRDLVRAAAEKDAWVIDGNYTAIVRDVIWSRATAVVWLDYPRSVVMRQVIGRSASRSLLRRELWNGNRERLRDWIRSDHPIRWAWEQHGGKRKRDEKMLADPRWAHLTVVRLNSPQNAASWLDTIPAVPASARHDERETS